MHHRYVGTWLATRPPTRLRRLDAARRRRPRPSVDRRQDEAPSRGVHHGSVSPRRPSLCRRRPGDVVPDQLPSSLLRRSLPVKLAPLVALENQTDNIEVRL